MKLHRLIPSIVILLTAPDRLQAQENQVRQDPCDPELETTESHLYFYSRRGTVEKGDYRCEGVYLQKVSAVHIEIVSFAGQRENQPLEPEDSVQIRWSNPGVTTSIRAQAIRPESQYRLDAIRAARIDSFIWPAHILVAQGMTSGDLGVVGWYRDKVNGVEKDIYLPLHLSREGGSLTSTNYELILLPIRSLQDIVVSIARVDADPGDFVWDRVSVGGLTYPEGIPTHLSDVFPDGEAVSVLIPTLDLHTGGVYYVEIQTKTTNGELSRSQFHFLHSRAM